MFLPFLTCYTPQVNLPMYAHTVSHSLHPNTFLLVVTSVILVNWPNICVCGNKVAGGVVFVWLGGGWYLQWILNLWLPPNPTPPRTTTHKPSQNGADKAAPFNLSQMCSPAPVCRGNCWRGSEGMKGGWVACKVLPCTYRRARGFRALSHCYQEEKLSCRLFHLSLTWFLIPGSLCWFIFVFYLREE